MSKQAKRKITVNISPKIKTLPKTRPSVFERLGTKANSTHKEVCHHWAQHGTCPYGKNCKYSSTHTLISPSKQRLAKKENESKKRHSKEGVHKRQHTSSAKSTQSPEQVWNQWDPTELEDVDAADLEKRREELQRELDLQMKMESKARKKEKKSKLESSPSTESSSSSTDSSSSSEESSSSSSSSVDTTRRKRKKTKGKQRDSSSSSEREQIRKRKSKTKQHSFKTARSDKSKKPPAKSTVKIVAKSPSPVRSVKKSQTPPPKIKTFVPVVNELSKSKSPRPSSRSSDHKEKHRTPSPKLIKEKEREKEKEKQAKDREREKEKDREKEKEKEREREKEKEREREKEREKEKEREREKLKEREREREQRGKEVRKREVKSPKRDSKGPTKDTKRRESPDSTHSRDRKLSPSRSRGSGSAGSRRDNSRKNSPTVSKDDRRSDKREDRDRSRDRDRASDKHRKDKRDSRDCTERDRDRERRINREEREAAREKDREEALARCQERQRERERLKELAKKEEERRGRAHREDRGLDKPTGDRVERLLPLPVDRVPPNRRGRSPNNKRVNSRDKSRDIRRDRTPDRSRSDVRKSVERHDHLERDGGRIDHIDRERMDRNYDHGYDRPDRNFDRDRNDDRDRKRDYGTIPPRLREPDRRHEEKNYESPYDRRLEDRRYLEMEDRFNENSRDDRIPLDNRDYPDDRRVHRDMWDVRDEREVERDRELDQRRYGREDSRPRSLKGREWDAMDYPDHEWDRGRRPVDWDGRGGGWDNRDHDPAQLEEEWRHYNRSMDSWTADDRRRWAEWRDRSRPQSTTSHQDAEEVVNDPHKRELPKSDSVEFPQQQEVENKTEAVLGKRPAEENVESPIEPKKVCVSETPLEDNLSEISDDADEILNREEDPPEPQIEETLSTDSAPKPVEKEVQEVTETSIASVPQKSPSPSKSPTRLPKEESIEDENMDLDFEEISEDELEEENRVKGLGDALGVDWASLVAESRPRPKPISSTKRRWESHNILVNIGISVEMAGEALVKEIYKKHEEEKLKEELEEKDVKNEEVKEDTSHSVQNEDNGLETQQTSDTIIPHPVAAIQVAIREKEAMRKSLFASAGPFRRALSARRDLAIRRHLCDLPINDTFVETPRRHDPELYKQALELFERNL